MALDLGFLDTPTQVTASGAPLVVPLKQLMEDPDQPRKIFNPESLAELAADINARGILQPIIVRPIDKGVYKILFGARRYRAAMLAGLNEIPVFVASDPRQFNSYAQVAENRQREGLSPLEEAQFIQTRLDAGEKRKDIAEQMGVTASTITTLCALIDPPAFLLELYESSKCRTPEYLYRIRTLYDKHPERVVEKVNAAAEITRAFVDELTASLKPANERSITPPNSSPAPDLDKQPVEPPGPPYPRKGGDGHVSYQIVLVNHSGRQAQLILTRRVSATGLGWIQYLDTGEAVEVVLTECVMDSLLEK